MPPLYVIIGIVVFHIIYSAVSLNCACKDGPTLCVLDAVGDFADRQESVNEPAHGGHEGS